MNNGEPCRNSQAEIDRDLEESKPCQRCHQHHEDCSCCEVCGKAEFECRCKVNGDD